MGGSREEEKQEVRELSFYDEGEAYDLKTKTTKPGKIYEQIYPASFAVYDRETKEVGYLPKKDFGDFELVPIVSQAVTKKR